MSLSFTSETREGYVKVVLAGQWDLMEILRMIGVVRAETATSHRNRVLVDVRDVDGAMPDDERFWVGKQAALALGPEIKLAVIGRPERINRVTEMAATERGGQLQVFLTEEDAVAWLMS